MIRRERETYAGAVYVTGIPLPLTPRAFDGLYIGGLLLPYYVPNEFYDRLQTDAVNFINAVFDFWRPAGLCHYVYLKD